MSYLPNGSTLRATFREMPPKRHNLTLEKSELLAHIVETIGGGVAEANRAFNSMRNVKSQVLVFDRIERVWHGCDWKPSDEEAQKDLESRKGSGGGVRSKTRPMNHPLKLSQQSQTAHHCPRNSPSCSLN